MNVPKIITLSNENGITLEISSLGATITRLVVPDKNNVPVNVVVGLDNLLDYASSKYRKHGLYLGSTIGRFAGRISKGGFDINNTTYPLKPKAGVHLHGGQEGFDNKYWDILETSSNSAQLFYVSPHMEEGYPGHLKVVLTFTVTDKNEIQLNYEATSDTETHVNLTNHSYFNLNGKGSILGHNLQIFSDYYLEVDNNLIPSGKLLSVDNTPYDYRTTRVLGDRHFNGLDDTYVLSDNHLKAQLQSKTNGITMQVFTNQPAMVVYTPPKLPNLNFRNNTLYSEFPAICFETQHFPDSPHHKHFPSTLLSPNETYIHTTCYTFLS